MTIITRSMSKPTKNNAKKETTYLRSIKKTGKGANFSGGRATLPKPPKEFTTLSVDIDFNEASLAWRSNKQSVGNGGFEYKTYEKSNSSGDRRSPSELVVKRLEAPLPNFSGCKAPFEVSSSVAFCPLPKRTRRAPQRYNE
uniref:Uncharacterized protein n=1 Tax=viral metagenome TaxID=1070528 RepID=A0A6C0ICM0_9ZZZZ